MTDNTLRWQDEILQLMYWMKGESLGANPTAEELNCLLNFTSAQLEAALHGLIASGLIDAQHSGNHLRFSLTIRGNEEGKRRFSEEFSRALGKESHLECGDPNCDCHAPGWDGVCHTIAER